MKVNYVKKALAAGQPQVGSWLSFGNVLSARLMARVGFPWLTVDLEHSPIDWQTASLMFAAIADSGCVPLARVPRGDHDHIKRVLDGGAMGIVVPMVNTVEQARTAVAAAKLPPEGNRSIGGSIGPLNYGTTADEYFAKVNDNVLVILQTESPQGVDNAEDIYSVPGVDAIFVGPNDLFWQMKSAGKPDPTTEQFEAMLQRILAAGKKCGTPVGLHVQSVQDAEKRIAEGWQFLALQSELKMMLTQAREHVAALGLETSGELARY